MNAPPSRLPLDDSRDGDIDVLVLIKGEERYVFQFTRETRYECLRTLGRFAANPELSFTWYDAAILGQKVRAMYPDK